MTSPRPEGSFLRNVWFYAALATTTIALGLAAIAMTLFFRRRAFNWFGAAWAWCMMRAAGVRLEVSGQEHLSPDRCQVVVANHSSNFDIYSILWVLRAHYFRFVAKQELKWVPVLGWALWFSGTPLLDRGSTPKAQSTMRKLVARMRRTAMTALVFPEGTRNRREGLLPFKKGASVLAIDLQAPIVPLVIEGARHIQARDRYWVRPGTLKLTFLPPLSTEGMDRHDRNDLTLKVQTLFETHLGCQAAPHRPPAQEPPA